MDDDEEKKPALTVVSDNRHLPARDERESQRRMQYAREVAQHALTNLAAVLLRTLAGSDSASYDLMHAVRHLVAKQDEMLRISGEWMSLGDEREALAMPNADLDMDDTDIQHRRWQRERAFEDIVQGSLRLAAHQVLDEKPHFGGIHSTRLIEQGIASLERAKKPGPSPAPLAGSKSRTSEGAAEYSAALAMARSQKPRAAAPRQESKQARLAPAAQGRIRPPSSRSAPFDENDLKELRKAIKAKDNKRIAELTAKIRPPR